jgi:regulator of sirC expression with transglutaminase-like and TPR domain
MPDKAQLTFLLKLLDDDSSSIRESVLKELDAFGTDLELELARQRIVLGLEDQRRMRSILEGHRATWLREVWQSWFAVQDDKQKLESALSILAQFMHGRTYHASLRQLLDTLAQRYIAEDGRNDARRLAHFLFKTVALQGALQEDYYNPFNSSLIHVIEQKRGIPITLACVYILVGNRLGFKVEGINLPGHFLAKCVSGSRMYAVDCYNGGHFLNDDDLAGAQTPQPLRMEDVLGLECQSPTIIARILRNIINAYEKSGHEENAHLMSDLLAMMEHSGLSLPT